MSRLQNQLAIALTIGVIVFVASRYVGRLGTSAGDFSWPLCAAEAVLAGDDPYGPTCTRPHGGREWPTNPMTTVVAAVPFVPFGPAAGSAIFALLSAALAFGIARHGERWQFLIFASPPFLRALEMGQWSPLLTAMWFLPALLPLALIKPHTAMPIVLLRLNRRRIIGLAVFGLATLLIDPLWPWKFWQQASGAYDGYIPLLSLPLGPLLALTLLGWRDERARLLFLMALAPQRSFYDLLPLWLIPSGPMQMIVLSIPGWILMSPDPWIMISFAYLPALYFVLRPAAMQWLQQRRQLSAASDRVPSGRG